MILHFHDELHPHIYRSPHPVAGSELPPVPPPKDGEDDLFVRVVAGGTNNGSLPGQPSDYGSAFPSIFSAVDLKSIGYSSQSFRERSRRGKGPGPREIGH